MVTKLFDIVRNLNRDIAAGAKIDQGLLAYWLI